MSQILLRVAEVVREGYVMPFEEAKFSKTKVKPGSEHDSTLVERYKDCLAEGECVWESIGMCSSVKTASGWKNQMASGAICTMVIGPKSKMDRSYG
jgi:hypothetical protein